MARRAGTNRIPNPSVETNTTGWSPQVGAVVTRDNAHALVGSWSGKVDMPVTASAAVLGNATLTGITLTGVPHLITAKVRLWGPPGITVSRVLLLVTYTVGSVQSEVAAIPMTGDWVEVTLPSIATDPAKTISTIAISPLNNNGAQPAAYSAWFDGADLRIDEPDCDTYLDGAQGTGYAWTGTAHASTSTRSAIIDPPVIPTANRAGTNRILNPSLETNTSGWGGATNAAVVQSGDIAWIGTKALRCIFTAENQSRISYSIGTPGLAAGVSHVVHARFRAWLGAGKIIPRAMLRVSATPSSPADAILDNVVGTGGWQEITLPAVTVTADKTVTTITLYVGINPVAQTVGLVMYVDGAEIRFDEPDVDSYIDGTLGAPRYAWTGAAHASTSTRDIFMAQVSQLIVEPVLLPAAAPPAQISQLVVEAVMAGPSGLTRSQGVIVG